jgi:hypothetical protein
LGFGRALQRTLTTVTSKAKTTTSRAKTTPTTITAKTTTRVKTAAAKQQ